VAWGNGGIVETKSVPRLCWVLTCNQGEKKALVADMLLPMAGKHAKMDLNAKRGTGMAPGSWRRSPTPEASFHHEEQKREPIH